MREPQAQPSGRLAAILRTPAEGLEAADGTHPRDPGRGAMGFPQEAPRIILESAPTGLLLSFAVIRES
jgi:hypothetical protein